MHFRVNPLPTALRKLGRLIKSLSCVAMILFSGFISANQPVKELVILTWSEYMMPEMVTAFEKEFNAKIKFIYYESDDHRDQLMSQTEGKGFDLLLVNGTSIENYQRQAWIKPTPVTEIDNLTHIEPRWQNAFPSSIDYAVPYFWGTFGIAYRKDLVSEPITSWKQFFEPNEELRGKILQVSSSRDIIGMALKSLGYSANSEKREEIREANQLLLKQKPFVQGYGYISLTKESSLVSGKVVAATVYGGDAANVAQHDKNIVYVLPEEGGNIWVDYFAFSARAAHTQIATAFINFINRPKWAAKNAEYLYLASANKSAEKYLTAEFLNDPVIYPSAEKLARSEIYTKLSPRASRRRAMVFISIVK